MNCDELALSMIAFSCLRGLSRVLGGWAGGLCGESVGWADLNILNVVTVIRARFEWAVAVGDLIVFRGVLSFGA